MSDVLRRSGHGIVSATRSLTQHRLRSGLSILGVICGVSAVVSMLAVGEGAKARVMERIDRLGARNIYISDAVYTEAQRAEAGMRASRGLTLEDLEQIRNHTSLVSSASGVIQIQSRVAAESSAEASDVLACSANYRAVYGWKLAAGRFLTDLDSREQRLVCVLGRSVSDDLGAEGRVGALLRIGGHLFTVKGILDNVADAGEDSAALAMRDVNQMILIPLESAGALNSGSTQIDNTSRLSEILVRVVAVSRVPEAAALISRLLEKQHFGAADYRILVPMELLNEARQTQRTFHLILAAIAGISLVVGGIGIMNIMLATVTERTREIGIRRAVGATRNDIAYQFLSESLVLTLTGGCVGLAAGSAAARIITRLAGWPTVITLWSVLLPFLLAMGVGVVFGLYPAIKAARMDPISALRFG